MVNTSKLNPMKRRDVAYYRQRQKNRVFTALVEFFAQEAERRGITKKQLAESLSKDPSQVTRWLSSPSNFELDTLSDLLLALDAELDHRIVRFSDRARPNYAHPLVAQTVHQNAKVTTESQQRRYKSTVVKRAQTEVKVETAVTAVPG
ncbi:helix-turn-helix domain-containing protein [Bradyrhizobium sp. cf659]|uniref:helix-turn-helix domain-containing protein n=1 Tax=Bradyrhizobium sp. cf659 TaxID=1761771 RepID=UPI0011605B79